MQFLVRSTYDDDTDDVIESGVFVKIGTSSALLAVFDSQPAAYDLATFLQWAYDQYRASPMAKAPLTELVDGRTG